METFTNKELLEDWDRHGIISSCVFHCLPVADKSFMQEVEAKQAVEIILTFNGREVSFKSFLENLAQQYQQSLTQEARKVVKERMGNLWEILDQLTTQVDRKIEDAFYQAFNSNLREE